MTKTNRYKSPAKEAIHECAKGMFDAGLMSKRKMQEFDKSCLTPKESRKDKINVK